MQEYFNPHSKADVEDAERPHVLWTRLAAPQNSFSTVKSRAEALHKAALVSTVTKTVGKLFETSNRTSAVICPSFHQSIITPLNDTFHLLPCSLCFKGDPRQLVGAEVTWDIMLLRQTNNFLKSKHKCSQSKCRNDFSFRGIDKTLSAFQGQNRVSPPL